MVKKVGGTPPKSGIRTEGIQSTKTVSSAKVDKVGSTQRSDGSQKVQSASRRITPETTQQLLQLIEEEADKLFSESGLPESKKETIKGAVRMAIAASLREDDTE